jgi:hypothetical protein
VRASLSRLRVIHSFADHNLWPERLEKTVALFKDHLDFNPAAILVDGYDWAGHSVTENAAMIGAFKTYAKMLGAELWMTAQTHREGTGKHPDRVPPPCDALLDLIDVALFLEPHGSDISVRLLRDHGSTVHQEIHLRLHPDTLRLVADHDDRTAPRMPPSSYTLLSGGADGAEKYFGETAEKWGMMELNFTFEGRAPKRARGMVRLTEEELAEGAVSPIYLEAHMHRAYPKTPFFQKVLQSIWHQVNTSQQVFVVGVILEDKTVKGGTGWAAELARVWHKPVYVFDQERRGWYTWEHKDWVAMEAPPVIKARRFSGTGTRYLSDVGRQAIDELFERSFGSTSA